MKELVDDRSRLINKKEPEIFVYKRRWWVVAVFCLFGFTQSMVWGSWGPIAEAAEVVFGWSDFNVAFPTNIADTCFLLTVLPMTILADTKGLRVTMSIGTGVMSTVTLLRCISLQPNIITPTAYLCGALGGFSATAPFACPPLLAALWFPPKQRPLATAFISLFNYVGLSMQFIIAPRLVPGPVWENIPVQVNDSLNDFYKKQNVNDTDENVTHLLSTESVVTNTEEIKSGIHSMLYLHAGLSVASFIMIILCFPSKPPLPPSITASIPRVDYKKAVLQILRNRSLWLVALAGALPIGVVGVWSVVLDVILKPIGVSQIDAGWIGFFVTLIGCLSGLFITKFSELFRRRRKLVLILFFMCAAICCTIFALICSEIIPFSLVGLYVTCIIIGICLNGTLPLFYDISIEASYPVAEGVSGGFLTMVMCVFGVSFLYLLAIPNIGTAWLNWVLLGAIVTGLFLLCLFPETYNRMDVDMRRKKIDASVEIEVKDNHSSKC